MAPLLKRWQSLDRFLSSPFVSYGFHVGALSLGALIGVTAAYYFDPLRLALRWDLQSARELGIISRSILEGYPKSKDVVAYLFTLGLPILFSLSLWSLWVRGKRRAELRRLFEESPQNVREATGRWGPWVLLVIACYLFVSSGIGYFYRPSAGWALMGEEGSHLAYIQSMLSGGIYGKDFTCPYGPMMVYPMLWLVKLFGTTIVVARTYTYLLNLIAYGLMLFIFSRVLTSKAIFFFSSIVYLAAFPPFTLPAPQWSYLRVILGLFSLLLVDLYLRRRKGYLLVMAGILTGQSLLFSQEVGVCSLLSQVAFLFLNRLSIRRPREGTKEVVILLLSTFLSVLPMLTAFYFTGALRAVLENVYEHPKYFALGYGNLPFLDLKEFLSTPTAEGMLFAYWIIAIYIVSAIHLLSSVLLFRNTQNRLLMICVLLFGILLFRSCLGRTDGHHAHFVSPPAFLLIFFLLNDAWGTFRNRPFVFLKIGSVVWVMVLSFPMFFLFSRPEALKSGLGEVVTELTHPRQKWSLPLNGRPLPEIERGGILFDVTTAEQLKGIYRFLREHTAPGEYTYFFPNEAAYYFLFDRNNPTRYACAYHAITRAQRLDLVEDLERKKPRYVIYSLSTAHIDGITEDIQVPEVVAYLKREYVVDIRLGDQLILKRKET